jgi:hypothetical protein
MRLLLGFVLVLLSIGVLVWISVVLFADAINFLGKIWKSRSNFDPARDSGWWRLLGAVLFLCGFLFICELAGFHFLDDIFVALEWQSPDTQMGMPARIFFFLLGCALVYVGYRCFGRAQRWEELPADEVMAEDTRPPVLYLRSFKDDPRVARQMGMSGADGFRITNEESEIAAIFNKVGPVIAIGKPGEAMPYVGAARIYVGKGDWQACVQDLMSQARLVILRAGNTQGLWWEIAESVKRVKPEKLIFLIPLNRRDYEKFRGQAETHFPCRLPEYEGWRIPVTTIRAVLFFDKDWMSHLLPVQETVSEYWLNAVSHAGESPTDRKEPVMRRVLENTFQPILAQKFKELRN